MNELRVKHLEMVQTVVHRLAGNSFTLKGWSITIVSAMFVLSAKDANERYAVLALFPALCFWGLDAFYVRQERLFRALHDAVMRELTQPEDQQTIPLFSLDTAPVATRVDGWFWVLWSRTVLWVHGPIVATVAAVTIYAAQHS